MCKSFFSSVVTSDEVTADLHIKAMCEMCCVSCSGESPRDDELRLSGGPTDANHVVAEGPDAPPNRAGQHFHQEPRKEYRQQGALRHLLRLRKHTLLQSIPLYYLLLLLLESFIWGCVDGVYESTALMNSFE